MKKILLLLGILSILLIAGCQKPQNSDDKNRFYVTLSYSEGHHPTNCSRNDFYGSFVDTQNWLYELSGGEKPERIVYADLNINQWQCKPRDNYGVWCDCHIKPDIDTKNIFDGR